MSAATSPAHAALEREANVIRQSRWFVVFVCVLIIAANAWSLFEGRNRAIRQAELANINLARALALQMDAVFGEAGNLLGSIAFDLEQREMSEAGLQSLQPGLVNAVSQMEPLESLVVTDAAGHWLVHTQPTVPADDDTAKQPYFIHHRDSLSQSPLVGAPIKDRATDRWMIPVSRRLNDPFGSFAGVVLATVDLEQIARVFATYEVGARGAIALVHQNGTVLARRPDNAQQIGRSIAGSLLHQQFADRTQGTTEAPSPIDGELRIIGFQHTPHQPLYVTVGLSKPEVLQAWWRGALVQTTAALVMCLVIGFAGASVVRAIRRRVMAERESRDARVALEAANLQLSHLVRHDALTGLANRRYLDSMLAEAVARKTLSRNPLALMMVDVDHFKVFNDTHGHQAGDECLRQVAAAIRDVSDREGGFAARYGGEEMAVLLLDHERPMAVAEAVRVAVQAMTLPGDESTVARVTVSVGVATANPDQLTAPSELIEAADRALYAAKASGRNQVVGPAAEPEQAPLPS